VAAPNAPIFIGLAGGTGSGKTTVCQKIVDRLTPERITWIQHDSYYRNWDELPRLEENGWPNFDHPDALDTALLIEHLHALRRWEPVNVPDYDFTTHGRTGGTHVVKPLPLILVEGILIFAEPALRALFDVKLYVDTDADLRFIRRLRRDLDERGRTIETVITQYLTTVRPMHLEFVEPSKRYADVIIPEGGHNEVALDMVVARLHALLGEG
jgi:uridine kinase